MTMEEWIIPNEVYERLYYFQGQPLIRCKDCKYYRDGDCWHEWDNEGRIYYQSVINEPNPDDYCSRAKMEINANG